MPGIFGNLSRRNLIFFAALALVMAALYVAIVHLPQLARTRLHTMLTDAGFPNAHVSSVSLRAGGLRARDIDLDAYGLDKIKMIDADLNWTTFLSTGAFKEVRIKGMIVSLDSETISLTAQKLAKNLLDLPYYKISLSDVTVDMNTMFGALRMTLEARINHAADGGKDTKDRDIKARIRSEQYQLAFTSDWEGALKESGELELFSNLEDGRLHMGPLRISRFNGWVGVSVDKGAYKIQSQMEAGSASFMDVPLQNLTLANELTPDQGSGVFRCGMSGMPDVLFTGDYWQKDGAQNFTALLKGDSLGNLLKRAKEVRKVNNPLRDTLKNTGAFEAKAVFQPDRRFVGGPLPFTLSVIANDKKALDGNILIYPDTFDVRGSLETTNNMTLALKDYFKIPSASISQNFIRLDGTAKNLLQITEESRGADSAKIASP